MSLGFASTARGAGRPHVHARTTAHSAKGPIAIAAASIERATTTPPRPGTPRSAATVRPTASAHAHGAISGRSEAARPARSAATRGRSPSSTATVASAVASAVSMPLTACAARGTDRAIVASAAPPRPRRAPSTRPDGSAERRARRPPTRRDPGPWRARARRARSSARTARAGAATASGVTPSVDGPCALNRQPTPCARWRA